jgi:hypothetical protein
LLDIDGLKDWLHRDLSLQNKLLLILATFVGPASLAAIRERGHAAGFKMNKRQNPSTTLGRSKGLGIRVPDGWELTEGGKSHVRNLGVTTRSPTANQIAFDLRAHLDKIQHPTTRAFAEEAIKCYEAQLHRSAIVMSWLAAVDVLHRAVVKTHLPVFNQEAKNANPRWKDAANEDGLGRMGEEEFLNRIASIGLIGKNQKEELLKCLKLRNGCGHPNSLRVGPNMVASHIETLLLNVFEHFDI